MTTESPRGWIRSARLDTRWIVVIFLAVTAAFGVELVLEAAHGAPDQASFRESVSWSRAFVPNLSRALNVLAQLVLTCISLAVPLTSNLYTPKFVEVFLRDRVNQLALGFYLFALGNAIFVSYAIRDDFEPTIMVHILAAQFLVALVSIVPYYFYLFRSLDPSSITGKLARHAERHVTEIARRRSSADDQGAADKASLVERLHHLGNLILRSLERADRDAALEAMHALRSVTLHYMHVKGRFPDPWFHPARRHFVSFSDRALQFLLENRTWVEMIAFQQLDLAYRSALQRAPDVVGDIADTLADVGIEAERLSDPKALRLTCRFFNTFVREALRRSNLQAIYDVFHHYAHLGRSMLEARPEVTVQIAKSFRYYGELAAATGMPYVGGIAAHDLERMIEGAYSSASPVAGPLLEVLVEFQRAEGRAGLRVLKSKVNLAAFFASLGLERERARVEASCCPCDPKLLRQIERDYADAAEPEFWEVTDRQENFDHIPADRAVHVKGVLTRLTSLAAGEGGAA
jgi:hypothetical protein